MLKNHITSLTEVFYIEGRFIEHKGTMDQVVMLPSVLIDKEA